MRSLKATQIYGRPVKAAKKTVQPLAALKAFFCLTEKDLICGRFIIPATVVVSESYVLTQRHYRHSQQHSPDPFKMVIKRTLAQTTVVPRWKLFHSSRQILYIRGITTNPQLSGNNIMPLKQ